MAIGRIGGKDRPTEQRGNTEINPALPESWIDGTSSGRSSPLVVRFQVPQLAAVLSMQWAWLRIFNCGAVTPTHQFSPFSVQDIELDHAVRAQVWIRVHQ